LQCRSSTSQPHPNQSAGCNSSTSFGLMIRSRSTPCRNSSATSCQDEPTCTSHAPDRPYPFRQGNHRPTSGRIVGQGQRRRLDIGVVETNFGLSPLLGKPLAVVPRSMNQGVRVASWGPARDQSLPPRGSTGLDVPRTGKKPVGNRPNARQTAIQGLPASV
jgi:hypothetical protein